MQITVSGRQVDVSESFRQVVATGIQDLIDKYGVEPVDVSIVLSKPTHKFHTDITSHIGRGVVMRASGEAEDAYNSFSEALDTLISRLRRHKKRLHHHHKHRDSHLDTHTLGHFVVNGHESESEHSDEHSPTVIAETKLEINTLSVTDALMRLDLSQENTLIFRNSMNDRLNVIYRRSDGNIGWVDTN